MRNRPFSSWLEVHDPSKDPQVQAFMAASVLKYGDGRPIPLFHGTNSRPFQRFEVRKSKRFILFSEFEVESKGFFLTENPDDAKTYGSNVAVCYARMTNPFLDPRREKHLGVDRLPYRKEMELMRVLAPMIKGEDVVYRDGTKGREHFMEIGVGKQYIRQRGHLFPHQWIYEAVDSGGLAWDVLDNSACIARMTAMGYDGTFVHEKDDYAGRSVFVPDADQIMLVGWNKNVTLPEEDRWWE